MKIQRLLAACVAATAIVAASDLACAAEAYQLPDFSASQTLGPPNPRSQPWKVHHSKSKFRVEVTFGLADIYLPPGKEVYRLIGTNRPDMMICFRLPDDEPARHSPLQSLSGAMVQRTPVGSETLDGHPCKVSTAVITTPDGKTTRAKLWEAQDLQGFPIQIETPGEGAIPIQIRFSDVVLAAPDPALFVPPARCQTLEEAGPVVEDTTSGLSQKPH